MFVITIVEPPKPSISDTTNLNTRFQPPPPPAQPQPGPPQPPAPRSSPSPQLGDYRVCTLGPVCVAAESYDKDMRVCTATTTTINSLHTSSFAAGDHQIYIYRASDACNYGDISNTRLSNIPGIELQFTYIEIPLLFLLLHMTSRQRRVQKSRPAEPLHAAEVRDRRSEVIS